MPTGFAAIDGGSVVFRACTDTTGCELWQSDGSESGTRLAADIAPGAASSDPRELTLVGSEVYFRAADPSSGRELWKYAPGRDLFPPDTRCGLGYGASLALMPLLLIGRGSRIRRRSRTVDAHRH